LNLSVEESKYVFQEAVDVNRLLVVTILLEHGAHAIDYPADAMTVFDDCINAVRVSMRSGEAFDSQRCAALPFATIAANGDAGVSSGGRRLKKTRTASRRARFNGVVALTAREFTRVERMHGEPGQPDGSVPGYARSGLPEAAFRGFNSDVRRLRTRNRAGVFVSPHLL
jgi:hypothetical protein